MAHRGAVVDLPVGEGDGRVGYSGIGASVPEQPPSGGEPPLLHTLRAREAPGRRHVVCRILLEATLHSPHTHTAPPGGFLLWTGPPYQQRGPAINLLLGGAGCRCICAVFMFVSMVTTATAVPVWQPTRPINSPPSWPPSPLSRPFPDAGRCARMHWLSPARCCHPVLSGEDLGSSE